MARRAKSKSTSLVLSADMVSAVCQVAPKRSGRVSESTRDILRAADLNEIQDHGVSPIAKGRCHDVQVETAVLEALEHQASISGKSVEYMIFQVLVGVTKSSTPAH